MVDEGFSPPILSPGLVLMFDAACPSGWTAAVGFDDLFVMGHDGDANYTETGGANHTHTMAHSPTTSSDPYPSHQHVVSDIYPSTTAESDLATSAPCASSCSDPVNVHDHSLPFPLASGSYGGGSHSHTLPNPAGPGGTATELPPWREAMFCQLTSFSTRAVPAAAIAMFQADCGVGWVEDESFRDRFLRGSDGDATPAETGGSDTHTHDFTHSHTGQTTDVGPAHTHPSGGTTGTASMTNTRQYSISAAGAPAHYHQVTPRGVTLHHHSIAAATPTVADSTTLPPYYEMNFCAASAPTCPPAGMVGFFPGACPAGWGEIIAARNRLIRGHDGDGIFLETGGSATHTHLIGGHTHTIGSQGHTHEYATDVLTSPTWWPELTYTASCTSCRFALFDHTHGGLMTNAGTHSHTVALGADFSSGSSVGAPPWREYVVCSKN
jgi:hypothetical protein